MLHPKEIRAAGDTPGKVIPIVAAWVLCPSLSQVLPQGLAEKNQWAHWLNP